MSLWPAGTQTQATAIEFEDKEPRAPRSDRV